MKKYTTGRDLMRLCRGIREQPVRITEEPETWVDKWNNICGFYGKGECPECGREVGLTVKGKITQHSPLD